MKNFFCILILLVSPFWTGMNRGQSRAIAYRVVHGWPQLPRDFVFGGVAGLDVDSHNHVFVFHRGAQQVRCFEGGSGRQIAVWEESGFSRPHGLEVDEQDNVWLTDVDLHQVFQFSHDGELKMALGTRQTPGNDRRHFNGPTDVAVLPDGTFFVADGYGNRRVVKFDRKGAYLSSWGSAGQQAGQFEIPHAIAVDDRRRVYVADLGNSRIQVFDENGNFLAQWKSAELGRPWGLDFDPVGHLLVADGGDLLKGANNRARVLRLDLTGKVLAKWGSAGAYDGQFDWAHGVAAGPDGTVYVGDVRRERRIQKFVPH